MSIVWRLIALSMTAFLFTSCGPQPPEVQFVRQKIPVEVQRGKPVTIDIHSLSGNGVNDVGIQCSSEVWDALTNSAESITVRLKSSNSLDTTIGGVDPRSGGTAFLGRISNVHYLFYIGGRYGAKASVEIMFPNAPSGITHAEIIIGKTPSDTGL